MLKQNVQDTYVADRAAIAQRILTSPLAAYVGYSGDLYRLDKLHNIARDGKAHTGYSFLSVEFEKAGTECSLEIREEGSGYSGGVTTDAEGNEYHEYTLSCAVNFPCHGSTACGAVLARLAFYQQVALLAAEIEAEFVVNRRVNYKMTRTAAEVVADNAKVEAQRIEQAYAGVTLKYGATGLRVGKVVGLDPEDLGNLPEGKRDVETSRGKKFSISINADNGIKVGLITRTA